MKKATLILACLPILLTGCNGIDWFPENRLHEQFVSHLYQHLKHFSNTSTTSLPQGVKNCLPVRKGISSVIVQKSEDGIQGLSRHKGLTCQPSDGIIPDVQQITGR